MTRVSRNAFLAALFLLLPLQAHAGRWVNREIFWQLSNQGGPLSATQIYIRDTLRTVAGGAALDTTGVFSLSDAWPLPRGLTGSTAGGVINSIGGSASDTTIAAYFVVAQDSAAAGTITLANTNAAWIMEGQTTTGNITGTLVGNWVKVDSLTITGTTQVAASPCVVYPINSIGKYGSPYAYENLRIRSLTWAALMPAARCFIRYYDPDNSR